MIDRFNFYDVYGYFLPGSILLVALWLPFGLVGHSWPPTELAGALMAVVLAYIAGQIIQLVAHHAFPSYVMKSGLRRYPSDLLLDLDNDGFSLVFKLQLAQLVLQKFQMDLSPYETFDAKPETQAKAGQVLVRRRDAFLLCRGLLIRQKIAGYAEQFEGMYTLMRGLAAAFALAFPYLLGWSISFFNGRHTRFAGCILGICSVMVVVLAIAIVADDKARKDQPLLEKAILGSAMIMLLAAGYIFGASKIHSLHAAALFAVASVVTLASAFQCFDAYKHRFAEEFAKAVWRDFAGFCLYNPAAPPDDDDDDPGGSKPTNL